MHQLSLIALLILLSLVIYRVTRFLLKDSLFELSRTKLEEWLIGDEQAIWRDKLYELITCPYCVSIYVSAATVAVADRYTSVPLPVYTWLAAAAGCMVVWKIVEDK